MRRISEIHLAFILALGLGLIIVWLITTDLNLPPPPDARAEPRMSR